MEKLIDKIKKGNRIYWIFDNAIKSSEIIQTIPCYKASSTPDGELYGVKVEIDAPDGLNWREKPIEHGEKSWFIEIMTILPNGSVGGIVGRRDTFFLDEDSAKKVLKESIQLNINSLSARINAFKKEVIRLNKIKMEL